MVVTHTHTKVQGERSLVSKVRMETDRGDCVTIYANTIINNKFSVITSQQHKFPNFSQTFQLSEE